MASKTKHGDVQKLELPNGWTIETLGKDRIAGGFVHIIDPQGEIEHRFRAQDFAHKPEETADAFLSALEEILPNLCEEPDYGFEVADGVYLCGNGQEMWVSYQHPLDRAAAFDDTQEIVYYDIAEWADDPEEVIGALLMAAITA